MLIYHVRIKGTGPICDVWIRRKPINHLLLVYFPSVDLSFLDALGRVGVQRLVIIEHHLPHQHHQFMQVLPWLQHKVTRVTCNWDEHIHVLTRLKEKQGFNNK